MTGLSLGGYPLFQDDVHFEELYEINKNILYSNLSVITIRHIYNQVNLG